MIKRNYQRSLEKTFSTPLVYIVSNVRSNKRSEDPKATFKTESKLSVFRQSKFKNEVFSHGIKIVEKPAYKSAKTEPPNIVVIYLNSVEYSLKYYSYENAVSFRDVNHKSRPNKTSYDDTVKKGCKEVRSYKTLVFYFSVT